MLCEHTTSSTQLDQAARSVDLWVVDCERDALAATASQEDLTPAETTRLSQFACIRARRTFATARSVLRRVLGSYLGIEPRHVPIAVAPTGKPYIDAVATPIHFNLAHSWPLVAVGVSQWGDVGVDLEVRNRPLDIDLLSRFVLAPFEQVDLLSAADHAGAFLTYWTIKEAVAKASSLGLRIEPYSIELDRSPLHHGARALTARVEALGRWYVSSRDIGQVGVVAVATQFCHTITVVRLPTTTGDFSGSPLRIGPEGKNR